MGYGLLAEKWLFIFTIGKGPDVLNPHQVAGVIPTAGFKESHSKK